MRTASAWASPCCHTWSISDQEGVGAALTQIPGCRLLLAHTRKLPERLKRLLKRRNAIEPTIGHMKNDGLLRRNWLKGSLGDAMHAFLCGAGHNLRLILAHLRVLYCAFFGLAALRCWQSVHWQRLPNPDLLR
jgi:hypothetical protein